MNRVLVTALVLLTTVLTSLAPQSARAQTAEGPKFLALAFATDDHGWAAGSTGIDVTNDGGHSWSPQFRGRRVDQLVIVRRKTVYALATGTVLHTGDDGTSWVVAGPPQPALKQIAFSSERDGLGIGVDGMLYATSDGAKSWHRSSFTKPVNAICFSDKRTGFAGGAVSAPALGAFDGIAKTSDGGRTWADATRPPTAGSVGIAGHSLHCTRGSVFDLLDFGAHAGGGAYLLARSIDAGRTWKPIVTGGQVAPITRVPQGPGSEATSMSAYSPQAAYIAGFCGACGPTGQSSFGSTIDGGKAWQNAKLDAIGFTSAPTFTSARHGWIGARIIVKDRPGATDEVLVTDDAGQTWKPIFTAR